MVNSVQLLLSWTQVPRGTQMSKDGFDMPSEDLVSQPGLCLLYKTDWWLSFHSLWNFTGKENVVSWTLADLRKLDWKITGRQVCKQSNASDAQAANASVPMLRMLSSTEVPPLIASEQVCSCIFWEVSIMGIWLFFEYSAIFPLGTFSYFWLPKCNPCCKLFLLTRSSCQSALLLSISPWGNVC